MTSSLLAESNRPSCVCIGRVASVLAELRLYWQRCFVSADFVILYDQDRFCQINTVLLIFN